MPPKTQQSTMPNAPGAIAARLVPPRIGPSDAALSPRQREILDDLDLIIFNEGFSRTTVKEIAERLRCSRRTLYELAPSRDELVLIVIDRHLHDLGRLATLAIESIDDPADQLETFMVTGASQTRRTTIDFRQDIAAFPAGQRLINAHFQYGSAIVAQLIADGIERGRFRNVSPMLIAEIIDASLERFQNPAVLEEQDTTFSEAVEEMTSLILAGLDPTARPAGRSGSRHDAYKHKSSDQHPAPAVPASAKS